MEKPDANVIASVPENLQSMIEDIGIFVDPAINRNSDARVVVDRALAGHCMCCEAELGERTTLVLTSAGILMLFCCTACMSDMQIAGFLEEAYDDIRTAITFRGGRGDQLP